MEQVSQNYSIESLPLADLMDTGRIIIPSFQRGVVWNKEHRKDFIETVKSGDPFGVVLVYKEEKSSRYTLIDGLQRLSTLKAYMANPLEFIDENDKFIDNQKLHELFVSKYKSRGLILPKEDKLEREKKQFKKKLISKMKESKEMPKDSNCWKEFAAPTLEIDTNNFDCYCQFQNFYNSFIDSLQLPKNILIHAIVYRGEYDNLPKVFERLNNTSVQLSKYEIFSSIWPSTKIIIKDQEIVNSVWSKYNEIQKNSNFEVDVTKEELETQGVSLFEYCFSLSEILNNKDKSYSFLFPKEKKSTDPTGFDLLALVCGLKINAANSLKNIDRLGGSVTGEFLVDLKTAIIKSVEVVESSIKEWCHDLKGNNIKNNNLYQIYHMIASVFKHMYSLNLSGKEIIDIREENKEWLEGFRKYAYKWYLYHRITDFWNKNRQVTDMDRLLNTSEGDVFYWKNISSPQFNTALTDFIKEKGKSATSRTIDNDVKLVLNYLYKLYIKDDKNREEYFAKTDSKGNSIEFDVEHIVPVSKFKDYEGLEMSSIGNLCYLPVKDNRSKRDKTIYQYADDRPSLTFNNEFLSLILYPKREELEFIDCSYDEFRMGFNKLAESRSEKIVKDLVNLLMKY